MTARPVLLWLILLLVASIIPIHAQKRHLVPDQYATIQAAIDAASAGDTVMVRPGSYHEFLVLRDSVVVRSEGVDDGQWNRALRTIIHSEGLRDGNGNIPPVVNCADGAVLDGFTVTGMDTVNHHLPGHSHAVQNRGTSATIIDCIVHSNGSTGIGSHDKDGREANPTIVHNKVYRNFGIGIGFNHTSKGVARENEVYENREVGIGIQNGASPVIEANWVIQNGWNGISAREGAWPRIIDNWIIENGTDPTGEGVPINAGVGIGLDSTGWVARPGVSPEPAYVARNTVDGNPSGGIMSRNRSRFYAELNGCINNGNFQISVTDGSEAVVRRNTAECTVDSLDVGGIVVARANGAAVSYNQVRKCRTTGIAVTGDATARIDSNIIVDGSGSGIHMDGPASVVTFRENIIARTAGPAFIIEEGEADIRRSLMTENGGGAIFHPEAKVRFINNTISASPGIAGRGVAVNGRSGSTCYNNIVVGYTVGFFLEENPVIDYNCTFGNQGYNGPPGTGGAGAVTGDPLFTNTPPQRYSLQAQSPCIDTGHPDAQYNDPDGTRADIGAFPFDHTTGVPAFAVPGEPRLAAWPTMTHGPVEVMVQDVSRFPGNGQLLVYSMLGTLLREFRLIDGHASVDLSSLPDGWYFLKTVDGGTSLLTRVCLRHR